MKRLRAVLIFLAAVMAIAFALLWFKHAREPRYAGKPVSYWFGEYCQPVIDSPNWRVEFASVAMKAMGSNAVPFLMAEAFNRKPDAVAWKKIYKLLEYFPDSWHLPSLDDVEHRRRVAYIALVHVRPPASLVLSQIRQALSGTNRALRLRSLEVCGSVGDGAEEAAPVLVSALADPDSAVQDRAISSLGRLGVKGKVAVPALVKLISNNSELHGKDTALVFALGQAGSNAAPALSPLKNLFLSETNYGARCFLAASLCQIDPRQDEAMSFLIQQLKTATNEHQFYYVTEGLTTIGTNAQAAVPALLDLMDSQSEKRSGVAIAVLMHIAPANEHLLATLKEKLKSSSADDRAEFAKRLLELEPGNREAQLALIESIREHSKSPEDEDFVLDLLYPLVKAGPAAIEVLPALRQIVIYHPNLYRPTHDMISEAIELIEYRIKIEAEQKRKK